jgi:hypothetical protein
MAKAFHDATRRMSTSNGRKSLWVAGLLLVSCGEGVSPLPPPRTSPVVAADVPAQTAPQVVTLETRLKAEDAIVLALGLGQSQGAVEARAMQTQPGFTWLSLRPIGGEVIARVAARAGGDVLDLKKLEVNLADVTLFDTGLTLTELRFQFAPTAPPQVIWSADRKEARVSARVTMSVAGSVRGEAGMTSPFQTQVFQDVPLELGFMLDDAKQLVASFKSAGTQSPSWTWSGMLETGLGRFEGVAFEGIPPGQAL